MQRSSLGLAAWVIFLLCSPGLSSPAAAQTPPRPPTQPATGPGGSEYSCASVTKQRYGVGSDEYWIFEPASPKPQSAPVIVFLHGWSATNPAIYGAWLDHLVRRGNIVIYPRYQADLMTPPSDFTTHALDATQSALHRLQTETGHVRPDLTRVAVVGHSMGGVLAANMAALAAEKGLPLPRAVLCSQPGKTWGLPPQAAISLEDLKTIAPGTLLLTVAGDRDTLVGDVDAKRIFRESTAVPRRNKDFVILQSDEHGQPPLIADHLASVALDATYDSGEQAGAGQATQPRALLREKLRERRQSAADGSRAATTGVNALDYYGVWKLFDGLCDAAFYGKNREYVLGDTPQQRFMGKWSDGTPVAELKVADAP